MHVSLKRQISVASQLRDKVEASRGFTAGDSVNGMKGKKRDVLSEFAET